MISILDMVSIVNGYLKVLKIKFYHFSCSVLWTVFPPRPQLLLLRKPHIHGVSVHVFPIVVVLIIFVFFRFFFFLFFLLGFETFVGFIGNCRLTYLRTILYDISSLYLIVNISNTTHLKTFVLYLVFVV